MDLMSTISDISIARLCSARLDLQFVQELLLELQHRLGRLQRVARDEKYVFHPIAERVDAGSLQADMVPREDAGDTVEQARPVARDNREHLVRAALVGPDVDGGRDREVPHAPREPAAARRTERRVRLELLGEPGFDGADEI